MSAAEGRVLAGRYEIGDPLGVGGMSEVFQAHDITLGRRVAVKLLRSDLARDPSFHERFRREAMAAASLNHPNIVSVYDAGEDTINGEDGIRPYIVMEYVDGITLRQLINSGRKLLPERALEISLGVLAALDYSHRNGIIHRDIKPANVMLTRNSDVRVMDFGIARAIADLAKTVTQGSTVMGTAQYISPEQARGESADARSDLYSAGCLLYELLTGRPPFSAETPVAVAYQHVSAPVVPPSDVDPTLPPGTDGLLAKALAKNPDERYQSADAFASDIRAVLTRSPLAAAATQVIPAVENTSVLPILQTTATQSLRESAAVDADVAARAAQRRQSSRWAGFAIALVVVVALVGGIGYYVWNSTQAQANRVTMPQLVGLTVDEARTSLNKLGLKLGSQQTRTSKDYARGLIIDQGYSADKSVAQGTSVDVTVSSGKGAITVPSLTNYVSIEDARAALQRAGLSLGAVLYDNNALPIGTVLSQDPPAGRDIDASTPVSITVSNGKVLVPDVRGKAESVARALLQNAGFTVNVQYQQLLAGTEDTVVDQTPAAAQAANSGSTVVIFVGKLDMSTITNSPTPSETSSSPAP